jgi:hypothetical protein
MSEAPSKCTFTNWKDKLFCQRQTSSNTGFSGRMRKWGHYLNMGHHYEGGPCHCCTSIFCVHDYTVTVMFKWQLDDNLSLRGWSYFGGFQSVVPRWAAFNIIWDLLRMFPPHIHWQLCRVRFGNLCLLNPSRWFKCMLIQWALLTPLLEETPWLSKCGWQTGLSDSEPRFCPWRTVNEMHNAEKNKELTGTMRRDFLGNMCYKTWVGFWGLRGAFLARGKIS